MTTQMFRFAVSALLAFILLQSTISSADGGQKARCEGEWGIYALYALPEEIRLPLSEGIGKFIRNLTYNCTLEDFASGITAFNSQEHWMRMSHSHFHSYTHHTRCHKTMEGENAVDIPENLEDVDVDRRHPCSKLFVRTVTVLTCLHMIIHRRVTPIEDDLIRCRTFSFIHTCPPNQELANYEDPDAGDVPYL
ncbi:hypothetical protein Y032_0051g2069 [Ancylostoma ceylanicum]|nr:hypothetical protein Y032_0051g2069 [Ancylostoma ceylanicum]